MRILAIVLAFITLSGSIESPEWFDALVHRVEWWNTTTRLITKTTTILTTYNNQETATTPWWFWYTTRSASIPSRISTSTTLQTIPPFPAFTTETVSKITRRKSSASTSEPTSEIKRRKSSPSTTENVPTTMSEIEKRNFSTTEKVPTISEIKRGNSPATNTESVPEISLIKGRESVENEQTTPWWIWYTRKPEEELDPWLAWKEEVAIPNPTPWYWSTNSQPWHAWLEAKKSRRQAAVLDEFSSDEETSIIRLGLKPNFPVPIRFPEFADFNNPDSVTLTPPPPTLWWRTTSVTPPKTVGLRSVTLPPRTIPPIITFPPTTRFPSIAIPPTARTTSEPTRRSLVTFQPGSQAFPPSSPPKQNQDPFPPPIDFTLFADLLRVNDSKETAPLQPVQKSGVEEETWEKAPFPLPNDFSVYADNFTPIRFADFLNNNYPHLKHLMEANKDTSFQERAQRRPTTAFSTIIQTKSSTTTTIPSTSSTTTTPITTTVTTTTFSATTITTTTTSFLTTTIAKCTRSIQLRLMMQEGKGVVDLAQNSPDAPLNISATFQWLPLGFYQLWVSKRNPYSTYCNPTVSFDNVMIHLKDFVSHYKGGPPVSFDLADPRLSLFGQQGLRQVVDRTLYVFRGKADNFGRRPIIETMFRGTPPDHMKMIGCGHVPSAEIVEKC